MPGRATYSAYLALVERIRGINGGATYHHNLEGRVFKRLWEPSEKEIPLPYACLPVEDAEASVGADEGDLLQALWIQPVYLYVADTQVSDEGDSEAGTNALKAFDDVVAALMSDWTLGGACEECRIVAWAPVGGETSEYDWGATRVDVQIRAHLGREFLGP